MRKRALKIETENGEAYMYRKGKRVRVVHNVNEQKLILESCHSDPTCRHYGVTKTWNRIAESFYWKNMISDVRELVRLQSNYC